MFNKIITAKFSFWLWRSRLKLKGENMKQNIQVHVITAKQEKLCKPVRVVLTCNLHVQVRVYVGQLNSLIWHF